MTISTRRLLARPSVESLLAIGLASPRPRDWIWLAGYTLIDFRINFQQSGGTYVIGEKDLGFFRLRNKSVAYAGISAYGYGSQCKGTCLQENST
jgi:hypothetical protein